MRMLILPTIERWGNQSTPNNKAATASSHPSCTFCKKVPALSQNQPTVPT